jgi:hypothetical protein
MRTGRSSSSQYNFILSKQIDASRVTGFEASTGFSEGNGPCTDREYSDHALILSEGGVRLESRTKLLSDRPVEDGFCVVRPAESASEAANLPCSELRVLEGSKVAD